MTGSAFNKPFLTEQEAVLLFLGSLLKEAQRGWPSIYENLKTAFAEKFVVKDEMTAAYDLYLALIALDLQAVPNLYPTEQANRVESLILEYIGRTENWGNYAASEVRDYCKHFRDESNNMDMGGDPVVAAIPSRLLHRWLGEAIRDFESEINGEKTGFVDAFLIGITTSALVGLSGFWKNTKTTFDLIEGELQLDWERTNEQERPDFWLPRDQAIAILKGYWKPVRTGRLKLLWAMFTPDDKLVVEYADGEAWDTAVLNVSRAFVEASKNLRLSVEKDGIQIPLECPDVKACIRQSAMDLLEYKTLRDAGLTKDELHVWVRKTVEMRAALGK